LRRVRDGALIADCQKIANLLHFHKNCPCIGITV
jgi:hypothetical protein